MLNSVVVFSFVALWHDLSFRLLAWGWLVVLFILPELGARWLLGKDTVRANCRRFMLLLTGSTASTKTVGGTVTFVRLVLWETFS